MLSVASLSNKTSRLVFAFAVGALIGVLSSFTVNCTLVEISINPFFAFYFGVLFFIISGLILYRVYMRTHPKPYILTALSLMVMFSGVLCFLLEKDWFIGLNKLVKVPLYSILGISVCFALLFSVIDLINYCTSVCCRSFQNKPLVETENQVYLVVATAVSMGFLFGLVFGYLDVEDEQLSHMIVALQRERSICYPIGALLGGIGATVNQYIRESSEYAFDPIRDDEVDDEFD